MDAEPVSHLLGPPAVVEPGTQRGLELAPRALRQGAQWGELAFGQVLGQLRVAVHQELGEMLVGHHEALRREAAIELEAVGELCALDAGAGSPPADGGAKRAGAASERGPQLRPAP